MLHSRLVCSVITCWWANHSRFRHSGCQRKVASGSRSGGALIEASLVGNTSTTPQSVGDDDEHWGGEDTSYISSHIPDSIPVGRNHTHTDLNTTAIEVTQNLHLSEDLLPLESELVDAILDNASDA